jgi:hypothetical protein
MQTRVITFTLMTDRLCSTDGTTTYIYFDTMPVSLMGIGPAIEVEAA